MPNPPLSGEFVLTPTSNTPKGPAPASASAPAETATMPAPDPLTGIIHNHAHSKPKFYSSLCHYPEGFTFQNQEADEEVILLIRRDFITNVPWILAVIFTALIPPLLFLTVPIFFPAISVSQPLIFLSIAFFYVMLFTFALLYFTIWYFNVGIVTNKRVLDIDVPNILVKVVSEARLVNIVDVTFTQVGGIRSIFDYGNIDIQTEGLHQTIEFDRAPRPNMIRKIIGELLVNKPSS